MFQVLKSSADLQLYISKFQTEGELILSESFCRLC